LKLSDEELASTWWQAPQWGARSNRRRLRKPKIGILLLMLSVPAFQLEAAFNNFNRVFGWDSFAPPATADDGRARVAAFRFSEPRFGTVNSDLKNARILSHPLARHPTRDPIEFHRDKSDRSLLQLIRLPKHILDSVGGGLRKKSARLRRLG
jgi:hypothetical protein